MKTIKEKMILKLCYDERRNVEKEWENLSSRYSSGLSVHCVYTKDKPSMFFGCHDSCVVEVSA